VLKRPVQPTQVVIGELPAMLRDIVARIIGDEPDMAVAAVVEPGGSIACELQRTKATVAIVAAGAPEAGCAPPLRDGAVPLVVSLTSDARQAFVHVAAGEISAQGLVRTIRLLSAIRYDD
jgi:hypothetical protein